MLCLFGFLKELRPSEPYIYEFLIGEWRNVTDEQVNQQVYPVGTYAYLAQLVIVFLITDLSRYKPLIILLGASGVVVWAMLLWTKSLWELQVLEVNRKVRDVYGSSAMLFFLRCFMERLWLQKLLIILTYMLKWTESIFKKLLHTQELLF